MRHEDVDSLTGLLSRRGLERRLQDGTPPGAAAVIDVDDLKSVNDRHGHKTGDAVLIEVARHLRAVTSQDDLLARAGGDEFYLVSSGAAHDCATALENALVALARGIAANGVELSVTFSAGVTTTDPSAGLAAIRAADTAMYQAKSEGRGRVVVHGPSTVQFGLDRRPFLDRMARMHGQIEQLFVESRTDALTGAGNRLALDEQLDRLDVQTWPDGLVCAVLFVDIDHFHEYNHDHGDAEGDRALQHVVDLLRAHSRSDDHVLRLEEPDVYRKGGEEFVVLGLVRDLDDALRWGERVRDAVEHSPTPHGGPGHPWLTVSIGVAVTSSEAGAKGAMKRASERAIGLKNAGRRNSVIGVDLDDPPPIPLDRP